MAKYLSLVIDIVPKTPGSHIEVVTHFHKKNVIRLCTE